MIKKIYLNLFKFNLQIPQLFYTRIHNPPIQFPAFIKEPIESRKETNTKETSLSGHS